MKKRMLAGVLALVMLFGLLPVAAMAAEGDVAMIDNVGYTTLDAAVAAAKDGDTIEVLKDCETAGLNLKKDLTIDGGKNMPTITFTDKGIALWGKSLTFKNCKVTMEGIGSTPYDTEWNWQTICASKDASLTLENAEMTMDGEKAGGKKVNSNVHAIYFCSNNKLNLTNSTLKISNYPQDALEWDGGDGGYNVNLTNSTFISDHNRSGFTGTFYATIDNSKVEVLNSAGNGSNGTYYTIKNNSEVAFDGNGTWGISAWRIDMTNDSKLFARNNGYSGVWTRVLNVDSSCTLDVEENGTKAFSAATSGGIVFQGNGTYNSVIEKGADVTIKNNAGAGIYTKQKVCNMEIGSAVIICNGTGSVNQKSIGADKGGGIYNVGTIKLDKDVVIYNNHASEAGDDIYNAEGASIAFAKVGSDWGLDDCDHRINGWYYDGDPAYPEDGTAKRWNAHGDEPFMEEFQLTDATVTVTGTHAFKAAHDLRVDDDLPALLAGLWLNTQDHYSYLIGYSDGTVRPEGKITRAEVATIFLRLLDDDTRAKYWSSKNDFSDVSADKWYNNAVSTLSNMGVIGGYADGTFRPDAPISRAEFAKIAVSFTQNNGSAVYNYFTDVKTTDWFAPYVTAAKDAGLIEGYSDGSFKPESKITRAEACAIVNRTLGRKPSKAHMKISDRIDWPDVQTTDWFYEAIMEATNSHTYQMGKRVETWNDKLPQRDWAALETGWANAYTGNGGEVR